MLFFKKHLDILLFLALSLLFVLQPQLDLAISSYFYDSASQTWSGNSNQAVYYLYRFLRVIPFYLTPALLLLLGFLAYKYGFKHQKTRASLFLLLSLAIGPGLLVHTVMKEGFDRARPRQVVEFQGQLPFTPAFVVSDQCPDGCASFVSGHAAMGYWLMVFAWITRRKAWLWAGIAFGLVASLGRISQGGHFLSDTIFAGFLCYFVYRILSYWLLGYSRITPSPESSESDTDSPPRL